MQMFPKTMIENVHRSTICNWQKLETEQISTTTKMDSVFVGHSWYKIFHIDENRQAKYTNYMKQWKLTLNLTT
jgi:hypothetical protein